MTIIDGLKPAVSVELSKDLNRCRLGNFFLSRENIQLVGGCYECGDCRERTESMKIVESVELSNGIMLAMSIKYRIFMP